MMMMRNDFGTGAHPKYARGALCEVPSAGTPKRSVSAPPAPRQLPSESPLGRQKGDVPFRWEQLSGFHSLTSG